MNNYNILADLHTHTIFSLHAYSTIKENIEVARQLNKGLKYLAITDHYFDLGANPLNEVERKNEHGRIAYQKNTIQPFYDDITILSGAEFNFGQTIPEGKDYWDKIKEVDWRPIGLHSWFVDIENTTLDELYNIIKNDITNKKFTALAHIERELDKINHKEHFDQLTPQTKRFLEDIVLLGIENNLFLEVNEQSLIRNEHGSADRLEYWLNIAKENDAKICLGTDAHFCEAIGDFENTIKLLEKVQYPPELILNCNDEMLHKRFR